MSDHIVINVETGQYECQHCGATQSPPKMPVVIDKLLAHMDMFSAAHRNCSKAPAQPAQKPVGQTICNTCNGTGIVRNLHDWTTGKKREQKCWNCHAPAAQQEQEPVAWISPKGHIHFDPYLDSVPLYTAPTKREWVGLTEEDFVLINQLCINPIQSAEFAERLLKEKNNG